MSMRALEVLDSSWTWRITASLILEELMVKSGRLGRVSMGELKRVNMRKAEWDERCR